MGLWGGIGFRLPLECGRDTVCLQIFEQRLGSLKMDLRWFACFRLLLCVALSGIMAFASIQITMTLGSLKFKMERRRLVAINGVFNRAVLLGKMSASRRRSIGCVFLTVSVYNNLNND